MSITKDRIFTIIKEHAANRQPKDGMTLDDLEFDSLDHLELVMAFEEEMAIEIPDDDANKFFCYGASLDELVAYLMSKNP